MASVCTCPADNCLLHGYSPHFVKCKWCGELTAMTATKECDGCHEVTSRLRRFALTGKDARAFIARVVAEILIDEIAQEVPGIRRVEVKR